MANKKQRVLLKVSGESISGEGQVLFSEAATCFLAEEIVSVENLFELAVVIGGGNIVRGSRLIRDMGIDPSVAHNIGMEATKINGGFFQNILEKRYGVETRLMIATTIHTACLGEEFTPRQAISHLGKGRVVLLAGGTGTTNLSTDAAMVVRALELRADVVFKGTKVDGIYDRDPKKHPDAEKIEHLTHKEYLARELRVIDEEAVTMAKNNGLTIKLFNIFQKGNLKRALMGEPVCSEISSAS